jgi:hypothetical protein
LNKITLNTSKTRFGYPTAIFFGFEVGKFGSRLAQKHLNPLNNLIPPTTIPELRRVLGLFVVSRKYVKNFAMRTKPLSDLVRGQQPVFKWEKKHQDAYEDIRDLLLSGIHLAAPDYALPFHLATDASEDGKGAVLYQLPDIPIDMQSLFSTRVHSPDNMAIIQFLSKSWGESERNRPPFYLEADALLWAMNKTKFYSLSSPFPLYTYSDHLPLQWMNKSEKGPVSQFMIENLSELDVIHQYITGPSNSIADAVSRHPLLGPQRLAPRGIACSLSCLLSKLPAALKQSATVHVHAASELITTPKKPNSQAYPSRCCAEPSPPSAASWYHVSAASWSIARPNSLCS